MKGRKRGRPRKRENVRDSAKAIRKVLREMKKKKQAERVAKVIAKTKRKKGNIKTFNFFVLAESLRGTTAAVIKAESFRQAFAVYNKRIVIASKAAHVKKYEESCLKGNVYYDGDCLVQKLKRWKKIQRFVVACIDAHLSINGVDNFE